MYNNPFIMQLLQALQGGGYPGFGANPAAVGMGPGAYGRMANPMKDAEFKARMSANRQRSAQPGLAGTFRDMPGGGVMTPPFNPHVAPPRHDGGMSPPFNPFPGMQSSAVMGPGPRPFPPFPGGGPGPRPFPQTPPTQAPPSSAMVSPGSQRRAALKRY